MNKLHTICDLCDKDITGGTSLEIRLEIAFHRQMDVCSDCLARPIWDLAEKARCLQVAQLKEMEGAKCPGPMGVDRMDTCLPHGQMLGGLNSTSAPQPMSADMTGIRMVRR